MGTDGNIRPTTRKRVFLDEGCNEMERTPIQLTQEQVAGLTERTVAQVRRLDCAMYNSCLDVAVSGDWPGFGCSGCQAYQAVSDPEQKMQDILALRAAAEAAENIEKLGKANRRIGVKPGADAKRRVKLKVVREWDECDLAEGTGVHHLIDVA